MRVALLGLALGAKILLPINDLGYEQSVRWCAGGVTGGIHNTLSQLLSAEKLTVRSLETLRDQYFGRSFTTKEGGLPMLGTLASSYLAGYEAVNEATGGVLTAGAEMNNVLMLVKVLPILNDLVSFDEVLEGEDHQYLKLQSLSRKICRLIEVEQTVPELVDAGHPFTCAFLDAIFTHTACADYNYESPDLYKMFPKETICRVKQSLLQKNLTEFHWSKDVVHLQLYDLRQFPSQRINHDVAVKEFFTYLNLYRGIRHLYQDARDAMVNGLPTGPIFEETSTAMFDKQRFTVPPERNVLPIFSTLFKGSITPTQFSSAASPESQPDLRYISGWDTVKVISFIERSRRTTESSAALEEEPVLINNVQKWLKKMTRTWLPNATNLDANIEETIALLKSTGIADYLDKESIRNTVKLLTDIKHLLQDPVLAYTALDDLLRGISLPYSNGVLTASTQHVASSLSEPILTKLTNFARTFFRAAKDENAHIKKLHDEPEQLEVPFAFVAAGPIGSEQRCSAAVGIRGTATYMEWAMDFQTWIVPDPVVPGLKAHRGVMTIAVSLLEPVKQALLEIIEKSRCDRLEVFVTGHSLGGSVAQNLAIYLDYLFGPLMTVHAVLFAPLKHLSVDTPVEIRPNLRTIIDVGDPLFHMPCSRVAFPRCGSHHIISKGVGYDLFSDHQNVVLINVPFQSQNVSTDAPLSVLQVLHSHLVPSQVTERLPAADTIIGAHSCAHSCAFSSACEAFRWGCTACPK